MNILRTSLGALLLASSLGVSAQKPMNAPQGGKQISDEFLGIFFEDINYSTDGGLYSELIQNGSFEFNPSERDDWGPSTAWHFIRPGHSLGYMDYVRGTAYGAIHPNNPTFMRLHIERVKEFYDYDGWKGVGLENRGFDGISLKAGAKYNFSVFLRNPDGKAKDVRVLLLAPGRERKILAETTINVDSKDWKKYEAQFTASEECQKASIQMLVLNTGEMDVDMVSLMPDDTFKGHGLRKDLAEALQALHPRFLRFPGGCVVHGGGDGFWNTYRWKTTVGPKETRKALKNTWGYHQSMGLGYFEYFQFCEDLGMQPVPILPCGVSCQGTNGGWNMWPHQAQDVCDMSEMDEWTQDALDLIEWANGDVTTKWGKVRADAGHPEPFNLKYLGIGNEEKITPEFAERFKYMYDRITKAHPEIVIVGTAGPGSHPENPDYEAGWKLADEIGLPIIDEHYYEPNKYFLESTQYDSYPRDRKTKVYLGEYAAKDKKLIDALAEGLYLLHVERNADVVVMTSYAPLFARKNNTQWNPDLIYFDNEKPYLTCSYYVQQMFGLSSGQYQYNDCVVLPKDDKTVGQSTVLNTKKRELYVKVCNTSAEAKKATLNLKRFSIKPNATIMTVSGNPDDENTFDKHPIEPKTENIKVKKNMDIELAPYSFSLITIKL